MNFSSNSKSWYFTISLFSCKETGLYVSSKIRYTNKKSVQSQQNQLLVRRITKVWQLRYILIVFLCYKFINILSWVHTYNIIWIEFWFKLFKFNHVQIFLLFSQRFVSYLFSVVKQKKPCKIDFFWPFLSLGLLRDLWIIGMVKSYSNSYQLWKNDAVTFSSFLNAISRDLDTQWKQKLHCCNDLQFKFSKQMWIWW